jgi:hypothetical protein
MDWLRSNCASGGYEDFQQAHSMPISLLPMKMARNITSAEDQLVKDQDHRVLPLILQDRPANQVVLLPAIHLVGHPTLLHLDQIGAELV